MSLLMVSIILTSHSLYVNKPAKLATPDELIPSVLKDKSFRIADLAREDFVIRNRTFVNCHIYGPAVIYPAGKTLFDHPMMMNVTPEAGLVETSNKKVSGAIVLEDCTVKDCTFHSISIIGSPNQIAKIRDGTAFTGKQP